MSSINTISETNDVSAETNSINDSQCILDSVSFNSIIIKDNDEPIEVNTHFNSGIIVANPNDPSEKYVFEMSTIDDLEITSERQIEYTSQTSGDIIGRFKILFNSYDVFESFVNEYNAFVVRYNDNIESDDEEAAKRGISDCDSESTLTDDSAVPLNPGIWDIYLVNGIPTLSDSNTFITIHDISMNYLDEHNNRIIFMPYGIFNNLTYDIYVSDLSSLMNLNNSITLTIAAIKKDKCRLISEHYSLPTIYDNYQVKVCNGISYVYAPHPINYPLFIDQWDLYKSKFIIPSNWRFDGVFKIIV
jgi:hypothetical protein